MLLDFISAIILVMFYYNNEINICFEDKGTTYRKGGKEFIFKKVDEK